MVETEIYLDKYQPYNSFVQFIELLHVALEKEQLKKLEDFENAKIQNFMAEILLEMGHQNLNFDKSKTAAPPGEDKKDECGC